MRGSRCILNTDSALIAGDLAVGASRPRLLDVPRICGPPAPGVSVGGTQIIVLDEIALPERG